VFATIATLAPSVNAATTPPPSPRVGGTITTTTDDLSTLDPVASGFSSTNDSLASQVFGSLFLPPDTPNGPPVADLATSYRFNRDGTAITISIRRGVRFSDGTPVNPQAVVWNLRRVATSGSPNSTLLSGVTNIFASGPSSVTLDFSSANYGFISACEESTICDIGSPSSFVRLGSTGYAEAPVGAGPFKIVLSSPTRLTLVRNPTYWDARSVYLERWNVIDVGSDPDASYQALIQDTAQAVVLEGIDTPASLIFQAVNNHNVTSRQTPSLDYGFLPLNASKPPFSDQRAREALDYCTNRTLISRNATSGYTVPAYVLAGPQSAYLPKPGGSRGAETLMPYRFDVNQAYALVQQIGGLAFQLDVSAGEPEAIANVLAEQWAACDIHALVVSSSTSQLDTTVASGEYQGAFITALGTSNPSSSMSLEWPASPLAVPGLSDPKLTSLVQQTGATSSPSRLAVLWHQIWFQENTDAIDIPLIAAGSTLVVSHCLRDFGYSFGITLLHAWLACRG
jgi:peptide/nickel transport system substrate-binding protein